MHPIMIHCPGDSLGPCNYSCNHKSCEKLRREAAEICRFCGTPIGYQSYLVDDHESTAAVRPPLVHLACAQKADAERKQREKV